MKVSLNWVKEYVNIDISVDELLHKIGTQLGEVESVEYVGKKYEDIVIAEVVSCVKHENADKLNVCLIDDGGFVKDIERNEDGLVQVVCGAPNVRGGLLVAWIPPGAVVPSTVEKEPFTLEAREIRGVVSNGMLASGHELDISDDHDGIIELTIGEKGGDFAAEYMLEDEVIIDIENKMFTHRPDCFGVLGVAREISGILGQEFPVLNYNNPRQFEVESELTVEVTNDIPELVPRFMARVIEGLEVKKSPAWIQARLTNAGIKPLNNLVDVTNYEMLETAQPLHAYDYDKLCKVAGTKEPVLETRLSKKGDTLKLLNGKTITFEDEETILITTNDIPVGIGGVMGGTETEVDENTTRIVLEAASFDMYAIRRASMRHGLFTEAVTRFSKGQSPLQCENVLHTASAGYTLCGANVKAGEITDSFQDAQTFSPVKVSADFINTRLGSELATQDMEQLLKNVQFTVTTSDETLRITPPFWRTDIEIPEDIVEEIGRLYGYHNLPQDLPPRPARPVTRNAFVDFKDRLRGLLASYGANELLTYSFVHGGSVEQTGQSTDSAFQINNALSPDLQYYRQSLLPSLLEKVHPNVKRGYSTFRLFELSRVHSKNFGETDGLPNEKEVLALAFTTTEKDATAYYQAKHTLEALALSFGVRLSFKAVQDSDDESTLNYQPGRAAEVYAGDKHVGFIGEFAPQLRRDLKLPEATAGFEVDLNMLHSEVAQESRYEALSSFPSVSQDISLKVPSGVTYADVYSLLVAELTSMQDTNAAVEPLDMYQKEGSESHVQMTFRLTISHHKKTLTSKEVNAALDAAAAKANQAFGAERI